MQGKPVLRHSKSIVFKNERSLRRQESLVCSGVRVVASFHQSRLCSIFLKEPSTRTKEDFEECFPFMENVDFIKKQVEKIKEIAENSKASL